MKMTGGGGDMPAEKTHGILGKICSSHGILLIYWAKISRARACGALCNADRARHTSFSVHVSVLFHTSKAPSLPSSSSLFF